MAERLFKINIATPEKTIYEGEISSLIAPGEMGYFGILADHAPLIANLVSGKITIREGPAQPVIFNSKGTGIVEVLKNNVSVLVDAVERI